MFWTIVFAILVAFLIIITSPIWISLLGLTVVASFPILKAILNFFAKVFFNAKLWAMIAAIILGGIAQLFFPTGFMIVAPSTYYLLKWLGKKSLLTIQKVEQKTAPV